MEVTINEEAVKEDGFANTVETDPTPKEILLTAAGEDETIEEGKVIITEGKEGCFDMYIRDVAVALARANHKFS